MDDKRAKAVLSEIRELRREVRRAASIYGVATGKWHAQVTIFKVQDAEDQVLLDGLLSLSGIGPEHQVKFKRVALYKPGEGVGIGNFYTPVRIRSAMGDDEIMNSAFFKVITTSRMLTDTITEYLENQQSHP